jgi:ethanolamine utilization protein EutJ
MTITWEQANQRLERAAQLLNDAEPAPGLGPFYVGIDLGTADIVVMVLNVTGKPVACFLEWAEVVRDGVVVDYAGAVDIVRRLVGLAQKKIGVEFAGAATSFPPGTEPRLSTYILERVGLAVTAVQDEPTCGRHITLVIAGHYGISFQEAEERKRQHDQYDILRLARPTLQLMCDIVAGHIKGHRVDRLVLTGGTCCLPGVDAVFTEELRLPIQLPCQPLLLTPLAIASLTLP